MNWMNGLMKKSTHIFSFYEHILECVAGKKEWKKDKYSCKVSKAVSVSDKAFALLLLSNSWEVFKEHAAQSNMGNSGSKVNVKPKFTGKRGGSRRFEGWTQEGIAEYNSLCQSIVADRNSDMGEQFENEFLDYMRNKNGNKRKRNDERQHDHDNEENSRPLRAWREDDITWPVKRDGSDSNVCMQEMEEQVEQV